jgi:hypothetical protein
VARDALSPLWKHHAYIDIIWKTVVVVMRCATTTVRVWRRRRLLMMRCLLVPPKTINCHARDGVYRHAHGQCLAVLTRP